MNRYIINSSYNKIELYFDNKPNEKILSLLKQNGWRWNQFDKNWSARKTEENLYFAKKVCPSNATPKVSASTQKVIPAINTVSFGQVSDAGETVGVVISKNNGRFNITSSKNMIKCVDCGKFISIHSLFCVSCGCSISHIVQTLFDEQARIKIKEIEQEILAEKKKQAEHNAEKERLKDKIRRMSNSYEDYSLIYEDPTIEELEELCEKIEASNQKSRNIEKFPVTCAKVLEFKNIDVSLLTPDAVSRISDRCANFDDVSKKIREEIKKSAPIAFRKMISSYADDDSTVKKLWVAYWKYISLSNNVSMGISLDLDDVYVKVEGQQKKITTNFLHKLKEVFEKKAREYLNKAYNEQSVLIDANACKKYLIYSDLSSNKYVGNKVDEIAAFELLNDYKVADSDYLFRKVKITEKDSIVGTSFEEHCSLDYKHFLVSIPPHRYVLGCPFLHTYEIVIAEVSIINKNKLEEKKTLLMAYCEECDKYYIYEKVFLSLIMSGAIKAKTILSSKSGAGDLTSMSPESLLRKCGYTVNANDNLSDEARQEILSGVIENKLYTPAGIVAHLRLQINLSANVVSRDMSVAISKWQDDIEFINSNY